MGRAPAVTAVHSASSRGRPRGSLAAVLLVGVVLVQVLAPPAQAQALPAGQSVADARKEAARLTVELADLRERSAEAIVRLEAAEDALGRAVGRSATLTRELEAARDLAGGTSEQLSRRVSALYRSGGSLGVWASLLDASSPADLAARKANVDKVVAVDVQRRDASVIGASRVAVLEEEARQASSDQVAATGAAETQAAELNDLMARQQAALDRATQRVRDLVEQERRAKAAAAAAALAREQAAQAAAAQAAQLARGGGTTSTFFLPGTAPDAGPAFVGAGGACPVGAVHSFTDTWGAPRSGGRSHQGTDVFAPYGSPAYAVVDGVIDRWGSRGLGGIALWLRGDDGSRYYYAHNAANVTPVGTRVQAGQLIAYVGTSGNAATTPPHIHFQAHPAGGAARNPYPWLAALCGR